MSEMGALTKIADFNWGKAIGVIVSIGVVILAAQHPRSFFAFIVKMILLPTP